MYKRGRYYFYFVFKGVWKLTQNIDIQNLKINCGKTAFLFVISNLLIFFSGCFGGRGQSMTHCGFNDDNVRFSLDQQLSCSCIMLTTVLGTGSGVAPHIILVLICFYSIMLPAQQKNAANVNFSVFVPFNSIYIMPIR